MPLLLFSLLSASGTLVRSMLDLLTPSSNFLTENFLYFCLSELHSVQFLQICSLILFGCFVFRLFHNYFNLYVFFISRNLICFFFQYICLFFIVSCFLLLSSIYWLILKNIFYLIILIANLYELYIYLFIFSCWFLLMMACFFGRFSSFILGTHIW